MIQYKCDLCGEVKNNNNISTFKEFPRYVNFPVFYIKNRNELSFSILDSAETHLCRDCREKIAKMFSVASID